MKKILLSTLLLLVMLSIIGCQPMLTGETYSRDDARQIQQLEFGIIEQIKMVQIEGTKSAIGAGSGAIIGGVAGSSIGGGRGVIIATVIGAIAGGMAGSAIEESVTKRQGMEITIRKESGQLISIVQELSPNQSFSVGDRVRVLNNNGEARVVY